MVATDYPETVDLIAGQGTRGMSFPIISMFLFPNCSSAFCPRLHAVLYRFGANGRVGVFSPLEGRSVRLVGLGLLIVEEAVIPCGVIRIN